VVLLEHPGAPNDKVMQNGREVRVGRGTTVYAIAQDETQTWYKVRTKQGIEGWVENTQVRVSDAFESRMTEVLIVAERPQVTSTPRPPQGTINAAGVVLLAHPGTYNDKVLYNGREVRVGRGTTVSIIARDQTRTWYKVRTDEGREGWVESAQVSVTTSFQSGISAVPIVAEQPPLPTRVPPPSNPSIHYWYPN